MTMHHPNLQQHDRPQAISRSYLDIRHVVKQFGSFTALKRSVYRLKRRVCLLSWPFWLWQNHLVARHRRVRSSHLWHHPPKPASDYFLPPEQRDFGIVFQSYALFPNLTVEENIAIGLRNQGMSVRDALEKVEQWLEMIGSPHRHKIPKPALWRSAAAGRVSACFGIIAGVITA